MNGIVVFGVLAAGLCGFLVVMFPIVLLANKAIGAPYEREAEQMKAELADRRLEYSEDGMKLRVRVIAPLAIGVTWMRADVRVDAHALYLMRYHLMFGKIRIGQPNFRITWSKEARVGGFHALPIHDRPTLEGDSVVIDTTFGVTAMRLRLSPRDARRLLSAIEGMH